MNSLLSLNETRCKPVQNHRISLSGLLISALLATPATAGDLRLHPLSGPHPEANCCTGATPAQLFASDNRVHIEGATVTGGWSAAASSSAAALYVSDLDLADGYAYPPAYQNDLRVPNVVVAVTTAGPPGDLTFSTMPLCDSKTPGFGNQYHGNACHPSPQNTHGYLYVDVGTGVSLPVYQFNGTQDQARAQGLHPVGDHAAVDLAADDCGAFITAFDTNMVRGVENDEDPEMLHPGTGEPLIPEGTTDTNNGQNPEKANGLGIRTQVNRAPGEDGWVMQLAGNQLISGVNDKVGRERLQAIYIMGHDLLKDDALYPPVYWNDWSWANTIVKCVPQILQPEGEGELIQVSYQLRGPVCQLEVGQFTGTGPRFQETARAADGLSPRPVTHDEFHGTSCEDGIGEFEDHPTRPIQVTDTAVVSDSRYKYLYLQEPFTRAYWPMYQFDGDNEWQTLGNYNPWHAMHPDGQPWRGGRTGAPTSGYAVGSNGNTFAHDVLQVRSAEIDGLINPHFDPLADPKNRKKELRPMR